MAELIGYYEDAGLILTDEMPDYLPVLLEFASAQAAGLDAEFASALDVLTQKLEECGSKYSILTKMAADMLSKESAFSKTGGL